MMNILTATDPGVRRAVNQDVCTSTLRDDGLAYALVCDGMGGENGGGVASALALEQIVRAMEQGLRPGMEPRALSGLMESALAAANGEVHRKAATDPALRGMGTTAILAVIQDGTAHLCHAGDSRAYVVNSSCARPITRDHTVVQMLLDRGEITPAQAAVHPERHYITKAVGVSSQLRPEFSETKLEEGECLLLCSDGLYNMVDAAELPSLCEQAMGQGDASCMIRRANEMGGMDNITVALVYSDGSWC